MSETEDQSSYEPRMSELSSCDSTMLDPGLPVPPGPGGLRVAGAGGVEHRRGRRCARGDGHDHSGGDRNEVTEEVTEVQTSQEEITSEVEVESIETRTSEELVTKTEKSTEPTEVTESTTTQKTICTGSPISFTLLVLVPAVPGLPLPQAPIELPRELLLPALVGGRGAAGDAREPRVRFGSGGLASARGRARAAAPVDHRQDVDAGAPPAEEEERRRRRSRGGAGAAPDGGARDHRAADAPPVRRGRAARDAETGGRPASPPCTMETTGRSPWPTSSSACSACKPCRSSAEPAEGKNRFEEESKEDVA